MKDFILQGRRQINQKTSELFLMMMIALREEEIVLHLALYLARESHIFHRSIHGVNAFLK